MSSAKNMSKTDCSACERHLKQVFWFWEGSEEKEWGIYQVVALPQKNGSPKGQWLQSQ
jgi:hypothetical protein